MSLLLLFRGVSGAPVEGTYGFGTYGTGTYGAVGSPPPPPLPPPDNATFTFLTEVAFDSAPSSPSPTWTDISAYVQGVATKHGRLYELDQTQAGVCTLVLDNSARTFDPTYAPGPYFGKLKPMRKVRFSIVYNGAPYRLYSGFAEQWPITWQGHLSTVQVSATDGFTSLARLKITGDFPQELSGARIQRVLNAAQWQDPAFIGTSFWVLDSDALNSGTILSPEIVNAGLDAGLVQLSADPDFDSEALSHIQEIATAETGVVFIRGDGAFVFHSRSHRFQGSGASPKAIFSDRDAEGIIYSDVTPLSDAQRIVNDARVVWQGGTAAAQDQASIFEFLRASREETLPIALAADAQARADWLVGTRAEPGLELRSLVIEPMQNADAINAALTLDIGDWVQVRRTPDATLGQTSQTLVQDCFIESVEHRISPPSIWSATYDLSPGDSYLNRWELDVSALDLTTKVAA